MNFEINSYENNNRATDGNDLQDIGSLGGEEDSLEESPADPKLEPPIDPRVKPMMVQARTKADP